MQAKQTVTGGQTRVTGRNGSATAGNAMAHKKESAKKTAVTALKGECFSSKFN